MLNADLYHIKYNNDLYKKIYYNVKYYSKIFEIILCMNKLSLNEIIRNNYVYYKYFIEEKFESGLVLLGWEVKAIRLKLITINNSYVSFQNQEAYVYNSFIQSKLKLNNLSYNPTRIRKLLLKKQELLFLKNRVNHHGYTIMVLNLFWKNSWIKVNIGLAKGKKKYDKRSKISINTWKREKELLNKCFNK